MKRVKRMICIREPYQTESNQIKNIEQTNERIHISKQKQKRKKKLGKQANK